MPAPPPEHPPLRAALIAQLGSVAIVFLLAVGLARLAHVNLGQVPLALALLQGGIAALIAVRQTAPRWWWLIHLGFAPLVVVVHGLDIAPGWFLAAFVLLLLVFWRTDKSRVPLYLTNRDTADTLLKLLPHTSGRIIDLGCGDGGLLRRLALARPDCHFVGIEHAPLTWLVARLRMLGLNNVSVRRGDFWREPLADYALVYAFLSPAPMPRLWGKACAEMRPGTLLVSNSFAVPDVAPEAVVTVEDRRETRLYLYSPSCQTDKDGDSAAFPAIHLPSDRE
jgi:hypothetical protein